MGEATDAKAMELQDCLLRQLMSEGILRYHVSQVVPGHGVVVEEIIKRGPVSFMVTTTKASLHKENETRMLSLYVDDSEAMNRRVIKKQAKMHGLNILPDESIFEPWLAFQTFLRKHGYERGGWKVVVPFAEALADLIPAKAARVRRDYLQIIAAIKSHALIHFGRRRLTEKGEIIADLDLDYVPVAELMGGVVSEGVGISVSKEMVETVEAVRLATAGTPEESGASATELAKMLNLHKTTVGDRLTRAAERASS